MSRGVFVIGLLLSAGLHLALLRCSMTSAPAQRAPEEAVAASVMETELAELPESRPRETKPEVQPEPERSSTPAPEPQPDLEPREPEPEPEPAEQPVSEAQEADPAPPQPDLAEMAEAETSSLEAEGDLAGAADQPEAPPSPELRIDWGGETAAIETLRAGQMKLAVLSVADPRPRITAEARFDGGDWRRQRYQPSGKIRYSNRLRVVNDVPAFHRARRQLNVRGDERLVVLVPTRIERLLESRQLTTAFERGLGLERVRRFGGRFIQNESDIGFEITRVQVRSE